MADVINESPVASGAVKSELVHLAPLSELRLTSRSETDSSAATVRLVRGHDDHTPWSSGDNFSGGAGYGAAELYGREIPPDTNITIPPGGRVSVFTWKGCSLRVQGASSETSESSGAVMQDIVHLAISLDARRKLAQQECKIGPRVLIVGAPSSGKSTVAQLLVNYSMRTGYIPISVELDPRGSIDAAVVHAVPPGCIGAVGLDAVPSPNGPDSYILFFGSHEVDANRDLHMKLCEVLSAAVFRKLHVVTKCNPTTKHSASTTALNSAAAGIVINAPRVANTAYISKIIHLFAVDVIIVVNDYVMASKLETMSCQTASELGGRRRQQSTSQTTSQQLDSPCIRLGLLNDSGAASHPYPIRIARLTRMLGAVPAGGERIRMMRRRFWKSYFFGEANDGSSSALQTRVRSSDYRFMQCKVVANDDRYELCAEPLRVNFEGLKDSVVAVPISDSEDEVCWSGISYFMFIRSVAEIPRDPSISIHGEEPQQNVNDNQLPEKDFLLDLTLQWSCHVIPHNSVVLVGDTNLKF